MTPAARVNNASRWKVLTRILREFARVFRPGLLLVSVGIATRPGSAPRTPFQGGYKVLKLIPPEDYLCLAAAGPRNSAILWPGGVPAAVSGRLRRAAGPTREVRQAALAAGVISRRNAGHSEAAGRAPGLDWPAGRWGRGEGSLLR